MALAMGSIEEKRLKINYEKINIFLAILFSLNSCKGQDENRQNDNNKSIKRDTMEYFDIDKYKNWEIDSTYDISNHDRYFKKGVQKVHVIFATHENTVSGSNSNIDETIQVEETDSTPYKTIKVFSYKTKSLLVKGVNFYDCYIGQDKEYDEKGNLIKETDNEAPYRLSVEDIIKIVKQEYNIDLMNTSLRYGFSRNDYEFPKYQIRVPLGETTSRVIIIDATTGKTVSDTKHDIDDKFKKNKETSKKMTYEDYLEKGIRVHQIYDDVCYSEEEWSEFVKTQSWWWRKLNT